MIFPNNFKTGLRLKENVPCTLSKHDFVKICNIEKASRVSKKTQTDFAKTNYQVSKHLARKNLHVRLNLGCLIIPIHQTKNIECNV